MSESGGSLESDGEAASPPLYPFSQERETEVTRYKTANERYTAEKERFKAKIARYKDENERYKAENEQYKAEIERNQAKIKRYEDEIERCHANIEEQRQLLNVLQYDGAPGTPIHDENVLARLGVRVRGGRSTN